MAGPTEKKGTSPYVTHFIFRPVQNLEVPGLGTATLLEAHSSLARVRERPRSLVDLSIHFTQGRDINTRQREGLRRARLNCLSRDPSDR